MLVASFGVRFVSLSPLSGCFAFRVFECFVRRRFVVTFVCVCAFLCASCHAFGTFYYIYNKTCLFALKNNKRTTPRPDSP